MSNSFRAVLRAGFRKLGWDIRRVPELGDDPFADMARLLAAEPHPLILDVGANVGQSARKFCRLFPSATIHSFEPSASTFTALCANCQAFPNVRAWNCAVGSAPGRLPLLENSNSDMSSFLEQGQDGWGTIRQTSMVDVITLDDFTTREQIPFVHILKSDTQGYDLEVFKGGSGLLSASRIALIYCEVTFSEMYKGSARFDEICRLLADNGFLLVAFYEKFFQNGLLGWTDMLFINRQFHQRSNASGPAHSGRIGIDPSTSGR